MKNDAQKGIMDLQSAFAIVFLWNCRAVYQNTSAAKTSSPGNIEKWSKLTRQRRS